MSDLAFPTLIDIDQFPCGCLITKPDTKIVFANQYFGEKLGWNSGALVGKMMDELFSKPAQLFCESYIIPTVLSEGQCCEVQVALLNSSGASIPKVASVCSMPNGNLAWSFLEAENRNRLFHELEAARLALQEQREQLELLAITDPLTGLSNRRDFENKGRDILERAKRSGKPVSVLMLDVDYFKALNDTYGHEAGDKALCILADVLKSTCRAGDIVARLGGDEFACLLADTDLDDAKLLSCRIRIAVEMAESLGLAVSIGVAESSKASDMDLFKLLKQADEALYAVKHARPDRTPAMVVTAPKLRVSG